MMRGTCHTACSLTTVAGLICLALAAEEARAALPTGSLRNQAFQAIDAQTVYVLGSDGNLWREHGDYRNRDLVDSNVRAFQALDATTVFVLGNDSNLWHETGNSQNRTFVDLTVSKFQAVSSTEIFVLGYDAHLWREHGSASSRDLIDTAARDFHARTDTVPETIYVLDTGSPSTLWREHGDSATRDNVDGVARAFQDVQWSATQVDVLEFDGNLWRENPNRNTAVWIDGTVRAYQDVGGPNAEIYVLGQDGNLWDEKGSMANRTKVAAGATAFQAMGDTAQTVFVLFADGSLVRRSSAGDAPIDSSVYSPPMMVNPEIVLVMWGRDYRTNESLYLNIEAAFRDIVDGPFMNGLYQYGIGRGVVVEYDIIDEPLPPAGTRPSRSWVDIQNNVIGWINNGTIRRKPSVNENNLVYFVVPPAEYELYLGSDPTKPSLGIQGLHWWTQYRAQSTRNDLVIATAKTYHPDDVTQFMASTDVFGHELVESFNDPYGGRKELGDPCITFPDWTYLGKWSMQQYWSAVKNSCINGNAP